MGGEGERVREGDREKEGGRRGRQRTCDRAHKNEDSVVYNLILEVIYYYCSGFPLVTY